MSTEEELSKMNKRLDGISSDISLVRAKLSEKEGVWSALQGLLERVAAKLGVK